MKYRRKPQVVDAVQWTGTNLVEVSEMPGQILSNYWCADDTLIIENGDDGQIAERGDWIVRSPAGRLDVYAPGAFESAFDRVPSSALPWIDAYGRKV